MSMTSKENKSLVASRFLLLHLITLFSINSNDLVLLGKGHYHQFNPSVPNTRPAGTMMYQL